MADTDSKAGLYAKMAAVMAEMRNIPKTGKNTHFDYKFVTADAVADKVRDLLSSKGVAFFAAIVGKELLTIQRTYTDKRTGEMQTASSNRWVVEFEFTFADSESGAYETRKWLAEADAADDKGINKCATAAEKYFLLKTFIVSSADEPDADADGGKKRQQGTQNARNGQQPPTTPIHAPAPLAGGQNAPLASTVPTPPTTGTGDALDRHFPPQDLGAVITPLNGDKPEHPQIGTINMKQLYDRAGKAGFVQARVHFDNLIELLQGEGAVRDAMNIDQAWAAIQQHYATEKVQA